MQNPPATKLQDLKGQKLARTLHRDRCSFFAFLFVVLMGAAGLGCSRHAEMATKADAISRRIMHMEIIESNRRVVESEEGKKLSLSMAQAMELAIAGSAQLTSVQNQYAQDSIEVEQAQSEFWPRFTAEATVEYPIGEAFDSSRNLTGGIFVRYDLMQAFFSDDIAAVRLAEGKKTTERINQLTKEIYYDLLSTLARIEYFDSSVLQAESAFAVAKDAQERMASIGTKRFGTPDDALRLEQEVSAWKTRLTELRGRRLLTKNELLRTLKVQPSTSLEVTDYGAFFPSPQKVLKTEPTDREHFIRAWHQRNDVRMAELDLFVSEMNIIAAKRKRLPHVTASIGVGHINLETEDENAALVPSFGISMPILDMGDSRRCISKAEVSRKIAESQLVALAGSIENEIAEALFQVKMAAMYADDAQKKQTALQVVSRNKRYLYSQGKADPAEFYFARMDESAAGIEVARTTFEFRSAMLALMKSQGTPILEPYSGK